MEAGSRPLGGCFGESWGFFWASWGPLGSSWRATWALFGVSQGPPGASWRPLGAEGGSFRFMVPLWAPSGARLGALLGRLGRF